MSTSEYLLAVLPYQLPFLALYVVGIVLAIVKLRNMPKSAVFALVGCGLLFLSGIVTTLLRAHATGLDIDAMISWNRAVGIVGTVTTFVATALIIAAIFVGRRVAGQPEPAQTLQGAGASVVLAPHRATAVLVLGILSLVVFPPLGIAAWVMGSNDLQAMRTGGMDRSGEGITTAGQALGIVGTILFIVGIVALLLWSVVVFSSL